MLVEMFRRRGRGSCSCGGDDGRWDGGEQVEIYGMK